MTELAEYRGRVHHLTVELVNEKKMVIFLSSGTPGEHQTRAAINYFTTEHDAVAVDRDSVVTEHDRFQGLLDTRGHK